MKKFSYFNEKSELSGLSKLSLKLTAYVSQHFPVFTQKLGGKFLLNTHAKPHSGFEQITKARELSLNSKAGPFHVHLFGEGNEVAIVSHGWGDTSSSMQHLVHTLVEAGYLVAAIDHVGHGYSSGKRSHLPAFIESLEVLLEYFLEENKQVTTLVGHSMGGLAILNLPESYLENKRVVMLSVPVRMFEIMFDKVEKVGISRHFLMRVLSGITALYGKTWQELDSAQHRHKLSDKFVFIHDVNDRYAPIGDVEHYIKDAKVNLIRTEGLGHRRIVSDTVVNQILRDRLIIV
jgi:pimeloyl-ACP methyl ester carboxylesterase